MLRKTKNLVALAVILIAPLSTLALSGIANADACNWTWNGATNNSFATNTNWTASGSGCGSSPATGDNLIFDNSSSVPSGSALNDNLSGVTFGNVTFSGTGSYAYSITTSSSDTFTLSGNLTDSTTSSSAGATLDLPVTFSGSSIVSSTEGITFGDAGNSYAMNIGSSNVTFNGNGAFENFEPITGSSSSTLTVSVGSTNSLGQEVANPNFDGTVNITSGQLELDSSATTFPDDFSAAAGLEVASGATLYLSDGSATSGTLAEPITAIGGTGSGQCTFTNQSGTIDCGAIFANLESGSTLTLAGNITLTGDSQFNDNDTIQITGDLAGAYTVQNIAGTLIISSPSNTSLTANGTYAATGNAVPAGSSGSSSTKTTPKTPDTGSSLDKAYIALPLLGGVLLGGGVYAASKKNIKLPVKSR